jgi:hypothetical protein
MIVLIEHSTKYGQTGYTYNYKTLNIIKAQADKIKMSRGDTLRIYSEFMSLISTKEWGGHWVDNK